EAPAPAATPAPTAAPAPATPEPTEPPFRPFEYEYGAMTIGVPSALPEKPADEGDSVLFTDPEAQWTVRFVPLTVQQTEIENFNLSNLMDRFRTMGNYQNVEAKATTVGPYAANCYSFEMNPDWVDAQQGYTTSYHEPHALYVVDYGDAVVGQWGGLLINVAAPEKTRGSLTAILEDPDVQMLLGNLTFHEGTAMPTVSVPGLTVAFPARWTTGSDGDHTLWAAMRGTTKGSIYFGSSIYSDPKEAAGFVGDTRELTFNGRTWYGGVRTSELSEKTVKNLELFTDFTEYHALYARLSLTDWESDKDFWDYMETDMFRAVMESVETDPAAFHNPEDDQKDKAGFECNNIGEISAYNGTDKDITIPAFIGQNEIVGVNYAVFKGNEDITSVTVSEGVLYIESQAFRDCVNLKTVVLPNSLTLIDSRAFEGCVSLESVVFGENLVEIGSSAFENCAALKDVLLPATVQLIGSSAFCATGTGEGRFECPAEGTVYEHMALADCSYDAVVIGPAADLTDYNIMQNFKGRSVTIGEGTAAIGEYFINDSYAEDTLLTEWNLPASLSHIGAHAFSGRKGLKAFDFGSVETMDQGAFSETGLIDIVIPGTLKVIPEDAFFFCTEVESITICEGVEVIGEDAFTSVGRKGKTSGTYNFLSDEEVQKYKDVVHVDDPEYQRFYNITLPSTLREIAEDAFLGVRLEGLYLPWLERVDQLPAEFHPGFEHFECVYVSQQTLDAQGKALNDYFSQDEGFRYWGGKVRVFEGRHHYWTEEELGIDA
nr:leucine-rich repeat domain-containing protein [Clostridiales bacterium]